MICICCGENAEYLIALAGDGNRFYLPNQHFRETGTPMEVPFCHPCMRVLEDVVRGTIEGLSQAARKRREKRRH